MILPYDPLKRSIDLALPKVALALALPLILDDQRTLNTVRMDRLAHTRFRLLPRRAGDDGQRLCAGAHKVSLRIVGYLAQGLAVPGDERPALLTLDHCNCRIRRVG
jgi:hypothetical protein